MRQGLRAVVSIVVFAAILVGLVVGLQWRRDRGSAERAETAVRAYAGAVAAQAQRTGTVPEFDALGPIFTAAVPVRSVRQRYFKGDLAVAWTIADRATPDAFVACVEMRSMDRSEAYGAAWAAAGGEGSGVTATRAEAGVGCGPPPATYADAVRLAGPGDGVSARR